MGGVEDALRLGLAPLRFEAGPVKWQCYLVEKPQKAFIAQFGELLLFPG